MFGWKANRISFRIDCECERKKESRVIPRLGARVTDKMEMPLTET